MMRNNKLNGLGRGLASCGVILFFLLLGIPGAQPAEVTFGAEVNLDQRLFSFGPNLLPVDLDGDGDLDLVTREEFNNSRNTLVWMENNGATATSFTTHRISNRVLTAFNQAAADLDGDGDMDLISSGGGLMWHENNGARPPAFTDHVIDAAYGIAALCAADLNKDGRSDLIVSYPYDKRLVWLENGGGANPAFTEHALVDGALTEICHFVTVADLDKDGDLDVIISCGDGTTSSRICYWLENNGATFPAFTSHLLVKEPYGRITPGDINGDGWTDLLIGGKWFQNEKGSSLDFTSHTVNSMIDMKESTLADFDGDGDLDILGLDVARSPVSGDDLIYWFENDGARPTPNFIKHDLASVPHIAWKYWYVTGVAACDLDRDGDVDPLVLYRNHGVLWYPNQLSSPRPVAVFKPNGGEQFKSGNPMKVAWRTSVTTAGTAVGVELWRSTTARVATLQSRAEGSAANGVGSTWVTIPLDVATRSDYRLRLVSLKNACHYDFSDGPFTITRTNAAAPLNWTGYE